MATALLLLAFIWRLIFLPPYLKRFKIKSWRKKLHIDAHLTAFQQIFAEVDGFKLSKEARVNKDAIEYVYGEIEFTSFIALVALSKPNKDTIFYDLGSGVGKAVIACALVFDIQKSCGIELFDQLHESALECKQRIKDIPSISHKADIIHFVNLDFIKADFQDATLIFINAASFIGEIWLQLNQRLEKLTEPEIIIITTSKKLISPEFLIIYTTTVQMSWGEVHAYIHKRQSPP